MDLDNPPNKAAVEVKKIDQWIKIVTKAVSNLRPSETLKVGQIFITKNSS